MSDLEVELEKQRFKREVQNHFIDEHGEQIPLEEIEVIALEASCSCNAGLTVQDDPEDAFCPQCGAKARIQE